MANDGGNRVRICRIERWHSKNLESSVREAQKGGASAQRRFVLIVKNELARMCYLMTGSHQLTLDMLEKICIGLLQSLRKQQDPSRPHIWIYQTALSYLHESTSVQRPSPDAERWGGSQQVVDSFVNLAQSLVAVDFPLRSVFYLVDIRGLSHRDTVKILNIHEEQLTSHLFLARRRVLSELKKQSKSQFKNSDGLPVVASLGRS